MKSFSHPLDALRWHVSGAIARGEGKPVIEQPANVSQNGTNGRVYGGDCNLVHIPDGTRAAVGTYIADQLDLEIRRRAYYAGTNVAGPLCPGCVMIALFNASVILAERSGRSIQELCVTMARAYGKLAENPAAGLTEEIEIILDDDVGTP